MAQLLPNGEQVFLNTNGDPLASGTVDFYIIGTTTRKTTWQDADGTVANTNPIALDAAGRAVLFGSGGYRQIVKDSSGNTIWDRNVYSADPDGDLTASYQFFTGDNSTTVFTLSSNVGTDADAVEIYVKTANDIAGRGGFGRMRPTTDYTVSGTSLTFMTAPPTGADPGTGTAVANIMAILPNSSVASAVAESQNNADEASVDAAAAAISASEAAGAGASAGLDASEAETNASLADLDASTALAAAAQALEAAYDAEADRAALSFLSYLFDSTTAMADPGTGDLRLNNATLSAVTAAALSATSAGGSDVSDFVASWDDATHNPTSTLVLRKAGDEAMFAVYGITAVTDNGTWLQLTLSHIASATGGGLADTNRVYLQNAESGNDGAGDVTGPGVSTDEALARFNGVAGNTLQNSTWTMTDAGILTAGGQERWVKGADLASANPLVLGTDGNYFDVTGITGFSSITSTAGTFFMLQFDGALTLTNGASLILPGAANITTAAGDRLIGFAEAANTVRVLAYEPVAGYATARIADNAVTLAKLATQAANTFLANGTAGAAVPTAIALAASQLAGRGSAGNITAITLGTGLSMASDTLNSTGGIVLQVVSMTIVEASGTTAIPLDDTPPLNTEGTEIGSQAITMADNTNNVLIIGGISAGMSNTNTTVIVALFRDTTCICTRWFDMQAAASSEASLSLAFAFLDSPVTAGSVTYSVRIGGQTAGQGWFTGSRGAAGADFGDTGDDGLILCEISAA